MPTTYLPLVEDSSNPVKVFTGFGTGSATTASFTPPANSLVLVMVAAGQSGVPTIGSSPSTTWTQAAAVSNVSGWSGMWYKYYEASPGSMTVTITDSSGFGIYVDVRVIRNAAPTGTIGTSGTSLITPSTTNFTASVTPTRPDSLLYAVAIGWSGNYVMSAASGFTLLNLNNDGTTSTSIASGNRISGSTSSTTVGFTSASANVGSIAYAEILPQRLITNPYAAVPIIRASVF